MTKKILLVLVLLALIGAFTFWRVTRQPVIDQALLLYGNVDLRQVALAFDATGRLASLVPHEGDQVSEGQLLGSLDTKGLELELAQAEAELRSIEQVLLRLNNGTRSEEIAQIKANLSLVVTDANNATLAYQRKKKANSDTEWGLLSQQDLDDAEARERMAWARVDQAKESLKLAKAGPRQEDIGEAKAQVAVVQAKIDLLQYRISKGELKAPLDAVVRSRLIEPGEMVNPQRPVLALAMVGPKWVRTYVSEVDLGKIQPGQTAQVSTDSHPDQALQGQVGYISSVAEFTPKTVETKELRTSLVYEVRIDVVDPDNRLRLGMPATVRIVTEPTKAEP